MAEARRARTHNLTDAQVIEAWLRENSRPRTDGAPVSYKHATAESIERTRARLECMIAAAESVEATHRAWRTANATMRARGLDSHTIHELIGPEPNHCAATTDT